MILIKTTTGPSPIHGTGLFAAEFIQKGTHIWRFDTSVDEAFTKEEVEGLPEPKRSEILGLHFAYINKHTGHYINCGDEARYVNRADDPNVESGFLGDATRNEDEFAIAARDIKPGEEIINDYRVLAAEGIDFQ